MWSLVLVVYLGAGSGFASIPDFVPSEIQEYLKDLHNKCIEENDLTTAEFDSYTLDNKSPKMMCYMRCLMRNAGWMSDDLKLQFDKIASMPLGPYQAEFMSTVETCKDIPKSENPCETAYNFNVCWDRVGKEHYFLP